jgi:phosphatidate cytidylyltransferase
VLRARLATAAVAIPSLLALILYPAAWPLAVFVSIIGLVGIGEYAAMAFPSRAAQRFLTIIMGTVLLIGTAFPNGLHYLTASLTLAVAVGLIWTLLTRSDFEHGLSDLGLSLVGIFYVGLFLPHFIWLHSIPVVGPLWVIFVILIGMAGDTGGYAVGHAIGRHKLMPRVSPGKTIEGAIGIIVASLLGGAVSKLIFLRQLTWGEAMLLAGTMAILGQLGDLSESIMKRTFGVKESGWLFPGHGGVLDRVDSLLFPVVFVYYYVIFIR